MVIQAHRLEWEVRPCPGQQEHWGSACERLLLLCQENKTILSWDRTFFYSFKVHV